MTAYQRSFSRPSCTDDPEYDPRTLHIPKSASNSFTPFEHQFWDIKRNRELGLFSSALVMPWLKQSVLADMDTVLFFQKGKFFELYEQDADIGSQVFDLKVGASAGIPHH